MASTTARVDRTSDGGVAINETDRLIASDKVEGTAVYNRKGEHLGSVYNFMVDKITGKAAYAVMSFGGFLGIGEKYHPVPWDVLEYNVNMGGYVVDLDADQLNKAPTYSVDDWAWSDPAYGRRVHDYYGIGYPYY